MTTELRYMGDDGTLYGFADLPSAQRVRLVTYMGGVDLGVLSQYLRANGATEAVLFATPEEAMRVNEKMHEGRPARLLRVVIEEVKDALEHEQPKRIASEPPLKED